MIYFYIIIIIIFENYQIARDTRGDIFFILLYNVMITKRNHSKKLRNKINITDPIYVIILIIVYLMACMMQTLISIVRVSVHFINLIKIKDAFYYHCPCLLHYLTSQLLFL